MPEAFFRAEGGVLVLNAEHSFVTHVTQIADVLTPVDIAKAGDGIPPPAAPRHARVPFAPQHAQVGPLMLVYQGVFGVGVENPLAEHRDGRHVVALLVDQVRGVVVEAEVLVGDGLHQAIKRIQTLKVGLKPVLNGHVDPLLFGMVDNGAQESGDHLF